MASSPCNSYSEPPIIEQVITEFFAKSLHIILESRSPYASSRNHSVDHFISSPSSSSSSSSSRPRDKWFNLALRDCPAALENFDLWRKSILEPLVIDVLLVHRSSASNATRLSPGGCLLRNFSGKDRFPMSPRMEELETKSDKTIERWVIQYESRKESCFGREVYSGSRKSTAASSHSSEIPTLYKKTYKRTIVMLRSLYVFVKLLPAYKIFQELNSSGRICPLSLSHRITPFVEPFTRAEDAEMNQFSFVPIDTPCGRLSLTVSYLPALEDKSSEPSTPLSTQFIMDYVGGPTTDPLKMFQSVRSAGPLPHFVSITRQHSWSNDHGFMRSGSPSPSPTYSDSQAMHCDPNVRFPPHHLHDQSPSASSVLHNASVAHKKNTSCEDYLSSSPFSPMSSPSAPTPNAFLRSESAPVNIPSPRRGRNSGLLNQALPPSSPKPQRPGCSPRTDTLRAQITTPSASQTCSPEGKLRTKKEPLRSGDFETVISLAKLQALSFGKDEVGSLPGLKCSSPHIPFSTSSSRLSLLDEFDDSEFACPFADDEDITESCNRVKLSEGKDQINENSESRGLVPVQRSPDAAVGALVQMLKTAPPLRQDLSKSVRSSQVFRGDFWNPRLQHNECMEAEVERSESPASNSGITASGLFKPRTTADALEELRIYKEMKEWLLKKGGSKSLGDSHKDKPACGGGGLEEKS
ncbi:autophagy-related protein 13b-like isoform X1 [Phoenix dactylifera]|uniref:Autophagy-related protein 13b-like isoform X1 n=1 Tax=Phoenix dactylifera TaxID=42345 RepID=A0A8B8J2P4_PHODC|nr:autophagy-related protein 13b-like isoform X1 [Phoenix dactylifera]XP_026658819.2 autophagy-related protein 13b-like isoform X1 [Phoenix dactylifera]